MPASARAACSCEPEIRTIAMRGHCAREQFLATAIVCNGDRWRMIVRRACCALTITVARLELRCPSLPLRQRARLRSDRARVGESAGGFADMARTHQAADLSGSPGSSIKSLPIKGSLVSPVGIEPTTY